MDSKSKENLTKKRRATSDQRSSKEKAPKKLKSTEKNELALMDWKVYDRRMDEVVKEAIKIYHNQSDSTEDAERIAYLSILKKICKANDWLNKRIVVGDNQIKCFTGKILTESNRKKFQEYSTNWIKNKFENARGKTNTMKSEAISKTYVKQLNSFGVKCDTIETKITNCRRSSKEIESNRLNKSDTKKNIENCGCCRLCGSYTRLVIDLNDNCGNFSFMDVVKKYCRVNLNDDPRLPQKVCIDCKISIENFIKFCYIVDENQSSLNDEFPALPIKAEIEDIAPPSPPLSTSVDESQENVDTFSSNQDSPDFRIESVHGSLVSSEFDFVRFNDETFYDDFDPVNKLRDAALPHAPLNSTLEAIDSHPPVVRESIEVLLSKIKKCSVPLQNLAIQFVSSDTESDNEDESNQESKNLLENLKL